jgi:hypothetical protein
VNRFTQVTASTCQAGAGQDTGVIMRAASEDWRVAEQLRLRLAWRPWAAEIVKFPLEVLGSFGMTMIAGALLVIAVEALRWLSG